jgi:hypothetical protein
MKAQALVPLAARFLVLDHPTHASGTAAGYQLRRTQLEERRKLPPGAVNNNAFSSDTARPFSAT